jgi:Protoglobin
MPLDWNAIRLDLLQVDEPMRATLREMRPFFAKSLPGILARFYDKVRHYDPSSGLFKDGTMQEAIRMQLHHWELIAAGDFGAGYTSSIARFCELNQRVGVAPQWFVGCRLMFIADHLMKAVEGEIVMPRLGWAAQAARDRRAVLLNTIAKAVIRHRKRRRALFRFQPPDPQGRHCGSERPFPHHHHLVGDRVQRTGRHGTLAQRQRRQHHAACDRGRQCLG